MSWAYEHSDLLNLVWTGEVPRVRNKIPEVPYHMNWGIEGLCSDRGLIRAAMHCVPVTRCICMVASVMKLDCRDGYHRAYGAIYQWYSYCRPYGFRLRLGHPG
jgi:hypothetical protein